VATESSAEVLRGNPNLDEVLALDDSGRSARSRELLAARKFDVALAYAGGLSWRDLLLAARLGIPNRIGYVHKGFSGLVTHPVSIHVPQPFPAYFRDLVSQVIGRPAGEIPALRPLVYPGPEHEAAVDRLSSDWGLDWQADPVLACAVTSRQESGIWPAESFLESIRHVRDRLPCAVIYFGARSDLERLNRLAGRTGPHTFVCAGNLDLRAVVALLRRCRVALTTDSGPRHLANAAGTPVVFVRNISFRAEEAGAYGENDHDMAPREWELVAPADQGALLARIRPEEVGDEVLALLRG
jgi:ADP-heptose:LPS heptosyltransferase